MKKIISLILVVLLVALTVVPAVSAANEETYVKRPLIYIRGNGDPIYTADGKALPAGIDAILGSMGGSLLNAYLERYGHLGYVKKVFYGDVLYNGHSLISDLFSGKIDFSDEYTQLYVKQN